MKKVTVKNDIVIFLEKEIESTKDVKSLHAQFQKETKIKCELRLFTTYYKQFQNGLVTPKEPKVKQQNFNAPAPQEDLDEVNIVVFNAGRKKLQKDIFVPYQTGKGIDRLFSDTKEGGGPMKGTVTVGTGGPGVGKSTLFYDIQAQLQQKYADSEIICLNTEMKELDLEWELSDKNANRKLWMDIPNFALLNTMIRPKNVFRPELCKAAVEKIFKHGYDVLFIDSFEDLVGKLVAYADMRESQAETFLLSLIEATCDGHNDRGVHTAVVAIQQETKGGVFKGSNKLKHAITGMLHIRKSKTGDRYVTFSKNRRSGSNVDKIMYFGLDKQGEMVYNVEEFEEEEKRVVSLMNEKARMEEKKQNFQELFRKKTDEKIAASGKIMDDEDLEEVEEEEEYALEEEED